MARQQKSGKKSHPKRRISAPRARSLWLYKLRYPNCLTILILLILGLGTAVSPLVKNFNFDKLINLNSQQTKTAIKKIIIRKPIYYSWAEHWRKHPAFILIVKSTKYQNAGKLPKNLQNPVLLALTSHQYNNSTPALITQKPALSARPNENENHTSSPTVKPANYQNEPEQVLKYVQNPVLLALTSRQYINSTPAQITQNRLHLPGRTKTKTIHLHQLSNLQIIKMNLSRS